MLEKLEQLKNSPAEPTAFASQLSGRAYKSAVQAQILHAVVLALAAVAGIGIVAAVAFGLLSGPQDSDGEIGITPMPSSSQTTKPKSSSASPSTQPSVSPCDDPSSVDLPPSQAPRGRVLPPAQRPANSAAQRYTQDVGSNDQPVVVAETSRPTAESSRPTAEPSKQPSEKPIPTPDSSTKVTTAPSAEPTITAPTVDPTAKPTTSPTAGTTVGPKVTPSPSVKPGEPKPCTEVEHSYQPFIRVDADSNYVVWGLTFLNESKVDCVVNVGFKGSITWKTYTKDGGERGHSGSSNQSTPSNLVVAPGSVSEVFVAKSSNQMPAESMYGFDAKFWVISRPEDENGAPDYTIHMD